MAEQTTLRILLCLISAQGMIQPSEKSHTPSLEPMLGSIKRGSSKTQEHIDYGYSI